MKEIKVDENTKLKLEPGVCLQITGAKQCNITLESAEFLNVDLKKVKNGNITLQSVEDSYLVISDCSNVDIAAYNSGIRLARN